MQTLLRGFLLALSLSGLVACAHEDTSEGQTDGVTLRGDGAPLTEAMDLCGTDFMCTLYGDPKGPVGPARTSSYGSETACVLKELKGEEGELTGYLADGSALFFDRPATWTLSEKTITLQVGSATGQTFRLACTSVR